MALYSSRKDYCSSLMALYSSKKDCCSSLMALCSSKKHCCSSLTTLQISSYVSATDTLMQNPTIEGTGNQPSLADMAAAMQQMSATIAALQNQLQQQ